MSSSGKSAICTLAWVARIAVKMLALIWAYAGWRRISAVAIRAINYFERQAEAEGSPLASALQSLLLWLCSYRQAVPPLCSPF